MSTSTFVPPGFDPPRRLVQEGFVLEPLGPRHNEADYDAWSSSIEHIRATPGFAGRSWPRPLSLAENLDDLERHERDFAERIGFTFTVLDPATGDVIGCVYIYPAEGDPGTARVTSWVRTSRAELDVSLWLAVRRWLDSDWPFSRVDYDARA